MVPILRKKILPFPFRPLFPTKFSILFIYNSPGLEIIQNEKKKKKYQIHPKFPATIQRYCIIHETTATIDEVARNVNASIEIRVAFLSTRGFTFPGRKKKNRSALNVRIPCAIGEVMIMWCAIFNYSLDSKTKLITICFNTKAAKTWSFFPFSFFLSFPGMWPSNPHGGRRSGHSNDWLRRRLKLYIFTYQCS